MTYTHGMNTLVSFTNTWKLCYLIYEEKPYKSHAQVNLTLHQSNVSSHTEW